jgi:hypothetical protein
LTFSKEGYIPEVVGVSLSSSLGASTSNVVLQRSSNAITGSIVSSSNVAVSGATIVATSGLTSLSTLSTDPNGDFRLEGLTTGWWTVTISATGFQESVVLIQVGNVNQNLGSIALSN